MGKLCTTGKARQALYDAIKKAREGQEAWVTFEGTTNPTFVFGRRMGGLRLSGKGSCKI